MFHVLSAKFNYIKMKSYISTILEIEILKMRKHWEKMI